ncbi:MAG: hypothetical protein WA840_18615 [Caulobacteraceae bacterium]
MIFSRTVIITLAGEEVARYRIHLPGRATPVQDADFILEARRLVLMRGLSRDDAERADYEVEESAESGRKGG